MFTCGIINLVDGMHFKEDKGMEIRNCKKMNFQIIYKQISKFGRTISELAEEYGMDEDSFIERIKKGLDPKLFSSAIKASERNVKQKGKKCAYTNRQEDNDMSRKAEKRMMENYRERQSNKDKALQNQKKKEDLRPKDSKSKLENFEDQRASIVGEISNKQKDLDKATEILSIREKTLSETKAVFDEAKKALEEATAKHDEAKKHVEEHEQFIKELNGKLEDIETQISKIKNSVIYLVAPGYIGDKPEYGTFYSTSEVEGFDTLSIIEAKADYAIEPELKDMVVAGYDSYKEYMNGLRFVMLCVEYSFKEVEYSVLVNDERLKRLLQAHVG